eukprot:Cvel_13242.t1-p1 / transcript=Cvel_13242.t1 / gene=Cvel_13242 / organism=Chromera_velia_CCMP2878 / gene_product=hypothetical protein / transcript_product=hypothetical protein / location=Cvel_scaffold897:47973-51701(-) / protein_length=1243 / sequence_SO=supercontig / SO=protein_coding / is_pseudo=false
MSGDQQSGLHLSPQASKELSMQEKSVRGDSLKETSVRGDPSKKATRARGDHSHSHEGSVRTGRRQRIREGGASKRRSSEGAGTASTGKRNGGGKEKGKSGGKEGRRKRGDTEIKEGKKRKPRKRGRRSPCDPFRSTASLFLSRSLSHLSRNEADEDGSENGGDLWSEPSRLSSPDHSARRPPTTHNFTIGTTGVASGGIRRRAGAERTGPSPRENIPADCSDRDTEEEDGEERGNHSCLSPPESLPLSPDSPLLPPTDPSSLQGPLRSWRGSRIGLCTPASSAACSRPVSRGITHSTRKLASPTVNMVQLSVDNNEETGGTKTSAIPGMKSIHGRVLRDLMNRRRPNSQQTVIRPHRAQRQTESAEAGEHNRGKREPHGGPRRIATSHGSLSLSMSLTRSAQAGAENESQAREKEKERKDDSLEFADSGSILVVDGCQNAMTEFSQLTSLQDGRDDDTLSVCTGVTGLTCTTVAAPCAPSAPVEPTALDQNDHEQEPSSRSTRPLPIGKERAASVCRGLCSAPSSYYFRDLPDTNPAESSAALGQAQSAGDVIKQEGGPTNSRTRRQQANQPSHSASSSSSDFLKTFPLLMTAGALTPEEWMPKIDRSAVLGSSTTIGVEQIKAELTAPQKPHLRATGMIPKLKSRPLPDHVRKRIDNSRFLQRAVSTAAAGGRQRSKEGAGGWRNQVTAISEAANTTAAAGNIPLSPLLDASSEKEADSLAADIAALRELHLSARMRRSATIQNYFGLGGGEELPLGHTKDKLSGGGRRSSEFRRRSGLGSRGASSAFQSPLGVLHEEDEENEEEEEMEGNGKSNGGEATQEQNEPPKIHSVHIPYSAGRSPEGDSSSREEAEEDGESDSEEVESASSSSSESVSLHKQRMDRSREGADMKSVLQFSLQRFSAPVSLSGRSSEHLLQTAAASECAPESSHIIEKTNRRSAAEGEDEAEHLVERAGRNAEERIPPNVGGHAIPGGGGESFPAPYMALNHSPIPSPPSSASAVSEFSFSEGPSDESENEGEGGDNYVVNGEKEDANILLSSQCTEQPDIERAPQGRGESKPNFEGMAEGLIEQREEMEMQNPLSRAADSDSDCDRDWPLEAASSSLSLEVLNSHERAHHHSSQRSLRNSVHHSVDADRTAGSPPSTAGAGSLGHSLTRRRLVSRSTARPGTSPDTLQGGHRGSSSSLPLRPTSRALEGDGSEWNRGTNTDSVPPSERTDWSLGKLEGRPGSPMLSFETMPPDLI